MEHETPPVGLSHSGLTRVPRIHEALGPRVGFARPRVTNIAGRLRHPGEGIEFGS